MAAQDMEHGKTFSNSYGVDQQLAQEMPLDSTQIAESQGGMSKLRVEVTVLRAHHVPRINKQFSLKRRFFVTVVNHATIQKTKSVQIDGQTVHWNQRLGAL
ncbi:hypothetical protein EDB92DRAFT_1817965 [Lactarius akahatsu]|uniref:Uncharacterized protein n=1 Tax=Lactarius akahatsu TaxID=416441 RepID=A0AAD4LB41_9AGAM|nr:hypothetical protein EDB92DRAFT_1817965 [Lactarius akahatsu]